MIHTGNVRVVSTRLDASAARQSFPRILSRAARSKERIIVSRRGKDLAAIVPIEDLRRLERLARRETDRQDTADARSALREARKKGTVSVREFMRDLGA